jgi:hypothetical protein
MTNYPNRSNDLYGFKHPNTFNDGELYDQALKLVTKTKNPRWQGH